MSETIVIKLGGNALSTIEPAFFKQIKDWQTAGKRLVFVHGGGPQIDTLLEKLHIGIEKKQGLRVTSREVLDVATMVLAGKINTEMVLQFAAKGFQSIGLNGSDNLLLKVRPIHDQMLGYVGTVEHVNVAFLKMLLDHHLTPVIAPLGVDANFQLYNVNADIAACHIAGALQAEQLILLTDVPGVFANQRIIKESLPQLMLDYIDRGVIIGGMIPKVKGAIAAVNRGVKRVHITDRIQVSGTAITKEAVLQ
ncbi:acetylglutamate kinase [Brochothrix campestris]|uniref:Acetylglutamate kinase n=1 Tax=Brochothrix campestris FSL F6-1037 TaxID=1265861 RepID=W7CQA1_9LIST|nr:acetylglutamate kinase [Brochothrix campestris]EUJ41794.1 acetylglutamate kinase [Brochothrix campestris FSL F6-1037]